MVHPFVDSNGQLSILLLSMLLLASGIPFPISFGFLKYKRARRHYIQCLRHATSHGRKPNQLAYLILCAFKDTVDSFFECLP